MLSLLDKRFPSAVRLLLMSDGTAVTTVPGKLEQQLATEGLQQSNIRAVYVRNTEGMTISVLEDHDISKPLFVHNGKDTRSIGRKELKRLRSSIQYTC